MQAIKPAAAYSVRFYYFSDQTRLVFSNIVTFRKKNLPP